MIESSIYVGDLRSHIGSHRDVHLSIPGEFIYSSLCKVVDEITCDLTLESVSRGIVIHGTLQFNFSAQCSYGLVDIVKASSVNVNELFEEMRHREIKRDIKSDDEETYSFQGDDLDIEQMLRDSILPSLPLAPVCNHGPENCVICSNQVNPYLSKDLGELSKNVIGEIDDAIGQDNNSDLKDPRWSALDNFPIDE